MSPMKMDRIMNLVMEAFHPVKKEGLMSLYLQRIHQQFRVILLLRRQIVLSHLLQMIFQMERRALEIQQSRLLEILEIKKIRVSSQIHIFISVKILINIHTINIPFLGI